MTEGQSSGSNVINNYAPRKLVFDEDTKALLLRELSRDKPVEIEAVGSDEDVALGRRFAEFLAQNGFKVYLSTIGMIVPPPAKPLTFSMSDSLNILIVDPAIPLSP